MQTIAQAQVGDLIYIPGQVTMLLGREHGQPYVILDVGGVGYLVHCPATTLSRLAAGAHASLMIEMKVSDDAIRQAQNALWTSLRLVTEPGGAAAFAALLSGGCRPSPGERIAVLVCGANTTAVNFSG